MLPLAGGTIGSRAPARLVAAQGVTNMAKILAVLYDDPVDGYPPQYARNDIPKIDHYDGGMTTPTPSKVDFGNVVAGVLRRIAVDWIVVKNGENFCHVCHSLCCDKACRRAAPDRAPNERQHPAAVSLFIRGSRSPMRRSASSFAFPLSAIGGRCFFAPLRSPMPMTSCSAP